MQFKDSKQAQDLLSLSGLIVDEEMCINLRGRMMLCNKCHDHCPSEALQLSIDAVDLDKEKCTGCNTCMSHCDAGALRSSGFIPDRFLSTLSGMDEAIHLHCRASQDKGGGIVIPCYQVLDARLMAAATADGITEITLHGLEHCESCEMGDARVSLDELKRELRDWMGDQAVQLHRAKKQSRLSPGQRNFQDQAVMDRRSFLRFGGARTAQAAAKWLVPGMTMEEEDEQDLLPFYQADDFQQRPSFYLSPLVHRIRQVPWIQQVELPWQVRTVTESCTACLSCGERCPTGALKSEQTNEHRSLSFDAALCTDCQLCESICPEQALVVQPVSSIEQVVAGRMVLNRVRQASCVQCGSLFVARTGESICQVCQNEQELDDEWLDILSG